MGRRETSWVAALQGEVKMDPLLGGGRKPLLEDPS